MPIRCAIYTRKSTDDGLEQEFNSLHAQREACEAYIKSQRGMGWTALAVAYDDGGLAEQCRPHRILEQFAPRTARLLPQSGQLLVRPSCRANTLRSRKQVCNSPFSIRQGRIVTTASQQQPWPRAG